MNAKDIAKAHEQLAKANAAESLLTQVYNLACQSGISEEIRQQFLALGDALGEHRSEKQGAATDSLNAA